MSDETTIAPAEGQVQTAAPTPAEAMPQHKEEAQSSATAATEERSFSQADIERIVGERLNRERQKYADYEELKQRSDKLKDIEDQNKSAIDKATEDAAAAKWELENERTSNLRFRAAVKHGIPEDYLDMLVGSNADEINASAERVGKLVADARALEELRKMEKDAKNSVHSTGRPKDNLRPGASPEALPVDDDSYPSSWLPKNYQR